MKKLLSLIVLVMLFSCEKLEDAYCWNCVKFYFTKNLAIRELYIDMDTVVKCDFTERDAQVFEKRHTLEPHVISVCGDVVRYSDCICEKQEE